MPAIFKLSVVKRGLKRGNDIVPILQIAAIPAKKEGSEIVGLSTRFFSRKSTLTRFVGSCVQRFSRLYARFSLSRSERSRSELLNYLARPTAGVRNREAIRRFVEIRAKETWYPATSFIRRLSRTFFVQQNVIGFYVAMYDFVTLQIIEGQSDLGNEKHYALLGEDHLLLDVIPEIAAKQ